MTKRLLANLGDMVGLTVTEVAIVHHGEEMIISFADDSFILLVTEPCGYDPGEAQIAVGDFGPAHTIPDTLLQGYQGIGR